MGSAIKHDLTADEWDVVVHNAPLVMSVVRTHRLRWHDAEDARQEGLLGLARGVSLCLAEKGALSTVASRHIRARILRDSRETRNVIHVPEHILWRRDHPLHADAVRVQSVGSLDATDAIGRPYSEDLASHRTADPAVECEAAEDRAAVMRAVDSLPDDQRAVVLARMHGETYKEIGKRLGFSKWTAAELEARAHARLREMLADYA